MRDRRNQGTQPTTTRAQHNTTVIVGRRGKKKKVINETNQGESKVMEMKKTNQHTKFLKRMNRLDQTNTPDEQETRTKTR